jgi:hypothetical protein
MEAVPDAQLLPVAQAPLGRAAGAAHFRRDVLPAAAADEDEPDDVEGDAVGHPGPAALWSDGSFGRQVMSDEVIKLIG